MKVIKTAFAIYVIFGMLYVMGYKHTKESDYQVINEPENIQSTSLPPDFKFKRKDTTAYVPKQEVDINP